MCNAPVVFCDVDAITGLMTAETIERAIIKSKIKIKVITVVHLGGNLCDMKKISKVYIMRLKNFFFLILF